MNAHRSEVARLAKELTDDVMCDGFHGWLLNEPDDPSAALVALDEIGASRAAAIVRRAFAKFPGGKPPADQAERESALGGIRDESGRFAAEDQDFFKYPDDVFKLADEYEATE